MIPNPRRIGLTDKEAQLYDLLLKLGEVDAGRLIVESGLKRPTIYKCLYSMAKKGIISQRELDKKEHFRAEPPQKLLEYADRRYERLKVARDDLSRVLPDLLSSYMLSTERPVVTTFEGVSGLKKLYEDLIHQGRPIKAIVEPSVVEPELFKWLTTKFVEKRVAAGIPVQAIVASGAWAEQYEQRNVSELRETRLVDKDKFPFQQEIGVYGSKVYFANYSQGQPLLGLIINQPGIARTVEAWFDLTWAGLTVK